MPSRSAPPLSVTLFRLVPLVSVLASVACAALPEARSELKPKPVSAYATAQSLPAGTLGAGEAVAADWPSDHWWRGWRDPALDALVEEALVGSPTLAMAIARVDKAQADAQIAGAADYPSLSVEAEITRQRQSANYITPPAFTPRPWRSYPQATLNLSWDLDFWGRNRAALAAATSQAEAARADLAQARLVLSASLASSWAEFARLWARHDIAAAAFEVRAKTVDLMTLRQKQGLETLAAVRRAESRAAAARGDLAALDEFLALQRNAIAALLGAGPDRGLSLPRPHMDLAQAPGLPPDLALGLLGRRPDVIAARLRVEAAESQTESRTAAFYPDVKLSGFLGNQSLGIASFSRSDSRIGSIGPALTLPLFEGGLLRGQLRGAQAERDEAVADYDQTLTTALRDVADVAAQEKALGDRLSSAQAANSAAEEAWSLQRQRYEGRLASALEVLTAEDDMLSSRAGLADLQSRAFTLDAALSKALGGGSRPPEPRPQDAR